MSDTAQVAVTVVCHLVALTAALTGLGLLAKERRRTDAALRRWGEGPGERDPAGDRAALVDALLGNAFDRTTAVVLLAVAVGAAFVGHLVAL